MTLLELSNELKTKMMEFPEVDWSKVAEEAITAKAFELRLSKSKELQKAVLNSLALKSRLTENDAKVLADKIESGISVELNEKGIL